MKKLIITINILAVMALINAQAAYGAYTETGASKETNTLAIMQELYGDSISGAAWCDNIYSGGGITIERMNDFNEYVSVTATSVLTGTSSDTDQLWTDGTTAIAAVAKARFGGFKQKFGYDDGNGYTELFDLKRNRGWVDDSECMGVFIIENDWEWIRTGSRQTWSSNAENNIDGLDHLITYQVNGLDDDKITWLLLWDDQRGGGDRDFNDFVVEIKGEPISASTEVPEPATITLMLMGGMLSLVKRKRR